MSVDWSKIQNQEQQFREYMGTGAIIVNGEIRLPPLMDDWVIYIDGAKALSPAMLPRDGQEHRVDLYGPYERMHVWFNALAQKDTRPPLRAVSTQ